MTMLELCMKCRNFHNPTKIPGHYAVTGGVLEPLPYIPDGAWIRIVGSVFNDGCWQYPSSGLTDEEFDGAVWLMHVPSDFVTLLNDINAWEAANRDAIISAMAEILSAGPYTSESFAGYTYQKKTGIGDVPTSVWDPRLGFADRIKQWRKI